MTFDEWWAASSPRLLDQHGHRVRDVAEAAWNAGVVEGRASRSPQAPIFTDAPHRITVCRTSSWPRIGDPVTVLLDDNPVYEGCLFSVREDVVDGQVVFEVRSNRGAVAAFRAPIGTV